MSLYLVSFNPDHDKPEKAEKIILDAFGEDNILRLWGGVFFVDAGKKAPYEVAKKVGIGNPEKPRFGLVVGVPIGHSIGWVSGEHSQWFEARLGSKK